MQLALTVTMSDTLAMTKVQGISQLEHPFSCIYSCSSTAKGFCTTVRRRQKLATSPILGCCVQKVPQIAQADLLVKLIVIISATVSKHFCYMCMHGSELDCLRNWKRATICRNRSSPPASETANSGGAKYNIFRNAPRNIPMKILYGRFWGCLFSRTARLAKM